MTALLNTYFFETGISFFHNNCETTIHDNQEEEESLCEFFNQPTSHNDGLDIHVREGFEGQVKATAFEIPSSELYISGSWIIPETIHTSLSSTLAHEVGHCLGLFHTFHGTCFEGGEDCEGNSFPPGNAADGDHVGDTPRDPRITSFHINDNCEWDGTIDCDDGMGAFTPLTDNFMSYSLFTCRTNFTDDQISRMCQVMLPEIIHDQNPLTTVPDLSSSTITNLCPNPYVDLNDLFNGDLPDGAELIWSIDDDSTDGISTQVSSIVTYNGTFFAYFYYEENWLF